MEEQANGTVVSGGDIVFSDTAGAKAAGEQMMSSNYANVIAELESAKVEISLNWEGDTTDVNDILSRIDSIIEEYKTKIDPSVMQLGTSVYYLAEAVEQIASSTKEDAVTPTGQPDGGTQPSVSGSQKPGFWEYHGNDFANDWDYSGCDSGLDYVGATVSGLIGTVGSTVNLAVDAVSEFFGWIFG